VYDYVGSFSSSDVLIRLGLADRLHH